MVELRSSSPGAEYRFESLAVLAPALLPSALVDGDCAAFCNTRSHLGSALTRSSRLEPTAYQACELPQRHFLTVTETRALKHNLDLKTLCAGHFVSSAIVGNRE